MELEQKRKRLLKALEQGDKIANLTAVPEWEWFAQWLRALQDIVKDEIVGENFINNHEGYLKALAFYQCYESIFNGVEQFKKASLKAGQEIIELDKYEDG